MSATEDEPDTSEPHGPSSPIASLYEDYTGLMEDLSAISPSGLAALNRSYHKVILIAAASNLEAQVKKSVEKLFATHGREELGAFVTTRVMARNYHTLFDWPQETAAGFFGSFGTSCKTKFKSLMKEDESFSTAHNAFMKLGNLRNQLVHQDYASFLLDYTPRDLLGLYEHASRFPASFESLILIEKVADAN